MEQYAAAVVETSDGGFALAGSVNDQNVGLKGYLIKTDSQGVEQWNRTIDSASGNYCELVSVYSNEGNITAIGKIYRVAVENTIISNYSNSGSLNRTNIIVENDVQIFTSTRTHDGGYALTGEATDALNPRPVIIKTDSTGNKLWRKDLTQLLQYYPSAIIQSPDNDFIITGNSVSYDPYAVFLVKKADSSTILNTPDGFAMDRISVYPNPTAQFLNIEMPESDQMNMKAINIINIQGQIVKTFRNSAVWHDIIDISNLAPGSYFIAFYNAGGRFGISKIIKE